MLRAVSSGPQIVVCSTCNISGEARGDEQGRRGGALLAAELRARQIADPALADIAIEEMPCLFACSRHCAVHIRAPGKISYILGDFAPTPDAAQAILGYARRHADSAEGQVCYDDWPEGVKGHFITRVPPEGFVVT